MTNYHKLGGLKQQKLLCVLKARNPKSRCQQSLLSQKPVGKNPSCLFELLVFASNRWLSLAHRCISLTSVSISKWPSSLVCLCLHTIFSSVGVCLNISLLVRTPVTLYEGLLSDDHIFNLMTSTKAQFPYEVTCTDGTSNLQGHSSTHTTSRLLFCFQ